MKRLTACLLFLFLASGSPLAATLLLPQDKAVLEPGKVLVLGSARAGAAVPVRIEAGDKVREGSMNARQDGQFYFAVPLAEGLNRLTGAGETREVFVPGAETSSPRGFAKQRMHGGDVAACESCHLPDLAVRGDGYPGVCLGRHEIESQNPANWGRSADERHFLASGRECGKCHDPHGATVAKLLLGPSQELCGACHGSRDAEEDIHVAFDEGGCVACHDPHYSGYSAQLAGPLVKVCAECHEEVGDTGHGGDLECSTRHARSPRHHGKGARSGRLRRAVCRIP